MSDIKRAAPKLLSGRKEGWLLTKDCDSLAAEYPGRSVAELPGLESRLDEISRDLSRWLRTFRCRNCGQLWEERYSASGHGEIATTRKISGSRP